MTAGIGDRYHSALRTEIIADLTRTGFRYKRVRLQHSKDSFTETLHIVPTAFSTAGFQRTDLLSILGFARSHCPFHRGECFCRSVNPGLDLEAFADDLAASHDDFVSATRELEACGIFIEQPEGLGFFTGKPSSMRPVGDRQPLGDGHTSPVANRLREAEDEQFRYAFTWIEGGPDKGWVIHYRPKRWPPSHEIEALLRFLPGFRPFEQCPEFDFSECWWRFIPWRPRDEETFPFRTAERAHRFFNAHEAHFSRGLELILAAHAKLRAHGLSFLTIEASPSEGQRATGTEAPPERAGQTQGFDRPFDVAFSFAGTERELAEELAEKVNEAGYRVFYDRDYRHELWGRDLVEFFDEIYRKRSRYCVIFISREYANRMWTIHERRSAQARALEEKGGEYILPIRVEDVDLPGLSPTLGYVSLDEYSIEDIADLLIKKLERSARHGPEGGTGS